MAREKAHRDQLAAEIAALHAETPLQLRQRWKALYASEPPRRASRDLMARAVAYCIQERSLGGLGTSTRRLLDRIADDIGARRSAKAAPVRKLHAGASCCAMGWCPASGNGAAKRSAIS